ncbi:MAG: NUDIX hydrolase [Weissella confusa]|nr:NUDIX hydrolase [Weissella confusa]
MEFKITSEATAYTGHIFNVCEREIETPYGTIQRQVVHMYNNAVAFMITDGERVLITKEYRSGLNRSIESIPAGKVNDGEDYTDALFREISEEVGISKSSIDTTTHIATVNSSEGFTDEQVAVYRVDVSPDVIQGDTDFDDGEYITSHWVSITEFKSIMLSTPHSAPAVVAALSIGTK